MPKKRKKSDLKVSLFPFLSILACVLGILTLMITAIVIAQIDPQAVSEKIEEALADDKEFQEKLEQEKAAIQNLRREVEKLRKQPPKKIDPSRKADLAKKIDDAKKRTEEAKTLRRQTDALDKRREELQEKVEEVTAALANAEGELETRKDPSKIAPLVVKPSGSGMGGDLEPTFVECTAEGIVAYGKDGKPSLKVKRADLPKSKPWLDLIGKVAREAPFRKWRSVKKTTIEARFLRREGGTIILKDRKGNELRVPALQLTRNSQRIARAIEDARKAKRPEPVARYVIFLVRDKGFPAWAAATKTCDEKLCKNGRLPLDGEGPIDLSLFGEL